MNYLFVDELWTEETHGSNAPVLRLGCNIRGADRSGPALSTEPFWAVLGGPGGVMGYMRMEFVAVIKGQSVFEARELRSASSDGPPPEEVWSLIWSDFE